MKKLIASGLFVFAAGCGGGGGETPTTQSAGIFTASNTAPTPTVTVNLKSDKATAMETNTYTLTWNSTNATNCKAEGDWTGTIENSGSKTLTAGGVGDKKYSVVCNNSGSTASAEVLVKVTKNICVNPHTDTKYPETYIGNWPIPQPSRSLDRNIVRMIGLKDYHEQGDSNVSPTIFDPACPKNWYAKLMITNTLDKLKSLGTERVWLFNYSPWQDISAENLVIRKERQQYPDEMIKFVVDEANKRGMEVYYNWMLDITDGNGNFIYHFNTNISTSTLTRLLNGYNNHMREHVKFLESIGVKGVTIDWGAMFVYNMHEHKALMYSKFTELAIDMRKSFSGKLLLNSSAMIHTYDEKLFSYADYYLAGVLPMITETEFNNKSVAAIKRSVRCQLSLTYLRLNNAVPHDGRCIENPTKTNIKVPPIIFEMLVQSRDRYLREGWIEDGFCTPGKLPNGTNTDCIQNSYVTDFSSQAFVTNAVLEELTTQTIFPTVAAINAGHYWHTDEIVPKDRRGFPNLSQSVRGKPAEEVIRYWFAK